MLLVFANTSDNSSSNCLKVRAEPVYSPDVGVAIDVLGQDGADGWVPRFRKPSPRLCDEFILGNKHEGCVCFLHQDQDNTRGIRLRRPPGVLLNSETNVS